MVPPPAAEFSEQAWSGDWYEIAKYQTFGGAIFEKGCICTTLKAFFAEDNQTYKVDNMCRKNSLDAKTTHAVSTLTPDGDEGHFKE